MNKKMYGKRDPFVQTGGVDGGVDRLPPQDSILIISMVFCYIYIYIYIYNTSNSESRIISILHMHEIHSVPLLAAISYVHLLESGGLQIALNREAYFRRV